MGIAIAGGSGILLGLGLLLWALRERSKRHGAELRAMEAEKVKEEFESAAEHNAEISSELEVQAQRLSEQLAILRNRLSEARVRLAKAGSPEAIKEWLDKELEAEEL